MGEILPFTSRNNTGFKAFLSGYQETNHDVTNKTLIPVTFHPHTKTILVQPHTTLFDAAIQAGFFLQSFCGGKGTCGKCKIKILNHQTSHTHEEISLLTSEERSNGIHLACKINVTSPLNVEILNYRVEDETHILNPHSPVNVALDSNVEKIHVAIPEPNLKTQLADCDALVRALNRPGQINIPLAILQSLPEKIREYDFNASVTIAGKHILSIEKGDTTSRKFGIAFDLGTTTIVGTLVNLKDGESLGIAARRNPQTIYGADVISRVNHGATHPDGLVKLQNLAIEALNEIINELSEKTGVKPEEIYEITVASNAIMNHLLLGINPRAIASAPYVPAYKRSQQVTANELRLNVLPQAFVHTLPNISGYVGGDINALILAYEIHHSDKMTLALDIGTNGEIVLGSKERLLSCSAAAGPAFEGGHISSGMRAESGAIDQIAMVNGDLEYHVIGNVSPIGICGTGLIDATAIMLKNYIIDTTGRIANPGENSIPPALRQRIVQHETSNHFQLASSNETQTDHSILITQKDIRELQLAKGAVAAGIEILLTEMGIREKDIEQILIAGAFGNYIDKYNTLSIGLIPNINPEIVKFVGNSASLGAKKFLLSKAARKEAHRINDFVEYIELSGHSAFQEKFMDAMLF